MRPVDSLKFFFNKLTDVPVTEWAYLASQLKIRRYYKGECLFETGEKSELIGYVVKGLVYTYYLTENGNLYVKNFSWEGKLISPYVSIISDKPSAFTAEALEETLVISITGTTLKKLYARHLCWERIGRKCAEALLDQREKREYEALTLDNIERYRSFRQEFKAILDRIPQHIVAGYLGINPVSLSRLLQKKDQNFSEKNPSLNIC